MRHVQHPTGTREIALRAQERLGRPWPPTPVRQVLIAAGVVVVVLVAAANGLMPGTYTADDDPTSPAFATPQTQRAVEQAVRGSESNRVITLFNNAALEQEQLATASDQD
jgi:hypothetical protein